MMKCGSASTPAAGSTTWTVQGYTGKRAGDKMNGNGKTRLLLSGSSQQAWKRRAGAQRPQGGRREFRRHLGLPVGQEQVQNRSGGGGPGAAHEGRQTAQDRARKEANGIPHHR